MALRFRFTDEQDVAAYGDGWWVWDEANLTRLRGRELVALEDLLDMPLLRLRQLRQMGSTLGAMAAMWVSMHLAGTKVAWADFNPMVNMAVWEVVPEAPLESGGDPAQASGSSTTPTAESATS
jgi:hypothetical protein